MSTIHSREQGSGPTVILLHGFPMHQQVWNAFAEKLSSSLKVVTADLPGFGKSSALPEGFTLEDVARSIISWIREKNYVKPVVVGHSLGGYVTLAMARQQRDLMAGMCMFHSTAAADNPEKKESRNKVLEFIAKHDVQAFTSNFINQLYADPQHSSITEVKNMAVQASRPVVEGYTKAMRDRPDQTAVLADFPGPILFLMGEKDQAIPSDSIQQQVDLNARAESLILPNVGHMGMFEAENVCLRKIENFVHHCQVTFP